MKRVFIVHGWSGTPESNWFPWMKRELRSRDISTKILHMPNADFPKMDEWITYMHDEIGIPDDDVFLVGHSLGCMAIMRFAESLKEGQRIGGMLLVAGFAHSIGIPYLEDFFTKPLNYQKIRDVVLRKIYINSNDDPFVPLIEGKNLENMLGGELIIMQDAGHINESNGFVTFSVGLDAALKLMQ